MTEERCANGLAAGEVDGRAPACEPSAAADTASGSVGPIGEADREPTSAVGASRVGVTGVACGREDDDPVADGVDVARRSVNTYSAAIEPYLPSDRRGVRVRRRARSEGEDRH